MYSARNPAHRLLQLAARSMGYDPGPADGWFGVLTASALFMLYGQGPIRSTEWAVMTLQRGLAGLGWYAGKIDGDYGPLTRKALGAALDAEGAHRASVVSKPDVIDPSKPILRPVSHGNVLRQGSAGTIIDTYCLHCAAVPGDWASGKSNEEIVAAINRMHTLPVARGGRGWSDTGYHAITCPDGEVVYARPMSRYGAGAIGYNEGVFHHLMIENRTITKTRHPEDYFPPETLAATKQHLEDISARTPIKRLMGHNEVAAKLCPGFDVIDGQWTDRAVA